MLALLPVWLYPVLFFAVLANMPFWLVRPAFGLLPNGWICLDFLLVGLLGLYLPRVLTALLLGGTILCDLAVNISASYFLPLQECLPSWGFLIALPGRRLSAALLILMLILLICLLVFKLPVEWRQGRVRRQTAAALVCTLFAGICGNALELYLENGRNPSYFWYLVHASENRHRQYPKIGRLDMEPLVKQVAGRAGLIHLPHQPDEKLRPIASALGEALRTPELERLLTSAQKPNVVLVLVESWGAFLNAEERKKIESPYGIAVLLAHYNTISGSAPFVGGTVAGEGRELCGDTISMRLEHADQKELQNCLPDRFNALGYHSVAVHGASGYIFDRAQWWKKIGFQEQIFRDGFEAQGLPECDGAFEGICDEAIARWIGGRLQKQSASPEFLYWVTLGSHLPVPRIKETKTTVPCPYKVNSESFCAWYERVYQVHAAVAAMAEQQTGRPTVFVVVGDHMPPFADLAQRKLFSASEVPYMILVPKELQGTKK